MLFSHENAYEEYILSIALQSLIITDRTDLDDQLSKQFVASKKYIGDETVVSIDSREKLCVRNFKAGQGGGT